MRIIPSDYPVLFEERALADTIAQLRGRIEQMVGEPSDDALLCMPTEDIVEQVYRNVRVQPVVIDKAGQSKTPVALGSYRDDEGTHRALENAFKFEVAFAFTGAMGMFIHYLQERPNRQLRGKREGGPYQGELLIAVHGENLTKDAVKTEIDREIEDIVAYMACVNRQLNPFTDSIKDYARSLVNTRKDQVLNARNIAASLGYEMVRRSDAPPTYVTQELQRIIKPVIPQVRGEIKFEPEPTIDETEYRHILDVMSGMALMMERSPRTFTKLREEEIRDHFLLQLNGHYRGNASGETFNGNGKTDILVRERNKNLFVCECKIWTTAAAIAEAVDQLLSYLTWRDTKAALVVFVKRKRFDKPLQAIMETVAAHNAMKRPEEKGETQQRFVFGKPEDPSREIFLTVMVFHIPSRASEEDEDN